MDLDITNTKATDGGCGCGSCGCGANEAVASTCNCGPDCTCGCQEGKPCTCGDAAPAGASTCGCGPDCTCGCQEGKPCTCADAEGTSTYHVSGMTCGHCVKAVTDEVSEIPGVTAVNVDLATGVLKVTSESPIDFDRIVEAVAEAGDYTVE